MVYLSREIHVRLEVVQTGSVWIILKLKISYIILNSISSLEINTNTDVNGLYYLYIFMSTYL